MLTNRPRQVNCIVVIPGISQRQETREKMSCEQLWSLFHTGLEKAIKEHIHHWQIKTNASAPWINEPLMKKIRRRDKAYKKSKKRKSPSQEAKFKILKMEMQRNLRKAYREYVESIITPSEDESTPFACMKRFSKFIKNRKLTMTECLP